LPRLPKRRKTALSFSARTSNIRFNYKGKRRKGARSLYVVKI
jgi:hypothetical protein